MMDKDQKHTNPKWLTITFTVWNAEVIMCHMSRRRHDSDCCVGKNWKVKQWTGESTTVICCLALCTGTEYVDFYCHLIKEEKQWVCVSKMRLQMMPNMCQFDSHNCKTKLKQHVWEELEHGRFVCHTETGRGDDNLSLFKEQYYYSWFPEFSKYLY